MSGEALRVPDASLARQRAEATKTAMADVKALAREVMAKGVKAGNTRDIRSDEVTAITMHDKQTAISTQKRKYH